MKFGVFIYEGVEPIDLATFGVLSMARRIRPDIEIITLARAAGPVKLSNGLVVLADHALDQAPKLDVLIVTGRAHDRPARPGRSCARPVTISTSSFGAWSSA